MCPFIIGRPCSTLTPDPHLSDQDDVDSFRSPLSTRDYNSSLARSHVTNSYTYQYATAPIRLSAACRQVNAHLTGPKAERSEKIDKAAMNRVWTAFADSWEEFESLRSCVVGGTVVQNEDTDRFISGWQVGGQCNRRASLTSAQKLTGFFPLAA